MKVKKGFTILMVFGILISSFLVGCSSQSSNNGSKELPPIKIGVIQPFSGAAALFGNELYRGNELAVEKQNQKGGLFGRKIVLVKADATNASTAVSEAERLISSEKVDILTGTYISSVAFSASDVANSYGKLWWETNALAANITDRGFPYLFRPGPSVISYSEAAINTIKNIVAPKLGKSMAEITVGIVHEQTLYGTSMADQQEKLLKEAGASVVERVAYDAASPDLSSVVARFITKNPDVWLLTTYEPDGILLAKTARDKGWMPKAYVATGGAASSPSFVKALGDKAVEGIISIDYPMFDLNREYAKGLDEYISAYKAKYGSEPSEPRALTSYSGTLMLFDVLEKAGSIDPKAVAEAAMQMDKPIGSYPNGWGLKFDPKSHNNVRAIPGTAQWQNGQRATVYPAEAAPKGNEIKGIPLTSWDQRK